MSLPLLYYIREKVPDKYKVVLLDLADYAILLFVGLAAAAETGSPSIGVMMAATVAAFKNLFGLLIIKDKDIVILGNWETLGELVRTPFMIIYFPVLVYLPSFTISYWLVKQNKLKAFLGWTKSFKWISRR